MTLGDRCDEIVQLIDEALVVPGGPPGRVTRPPTAGRARSPSSPLPGRADAPLTPYRWPVPDGRWRAQGPGPANRAS
jgi:hypothetical protein